jgi:hypothetical protein
MLPSRRCQLGRLCTIDQWRGGNGAQTVSADSFTGTIAPAQTLQKLDNVMRS